MKTFVNTIFCLIAGRFNFTSKKCRHVLLVRTAASKEYYIIIRTAGSVSDAAAAVLLTNRVVASRTFFRPK